MTTDGLSTAAVKSVCYLLTVEQRLHRASDSETTTDSDLMLTASPEDRERLSSSDDYSGDDYVEAIGPDDVDDHVELIMTTVNRSSDQQSLRFHRKKSRSSVPDRRCRRQTTATTSSTIVTMSKRPILSTRPTTKPWSNRYRERR
jgi:hypothetical protein